MIRGQDSLPGHSFHATTKPTNAPSFLLWYG